MRNDREVSSQNLNGLILAQSALVGIAVGLFDSQLWLPGGAGATHYVNGMTYAMGALAIQVVATYFFKMFFEENMIERARVADMQRARNLAFQDQQFNYDQRRMDMELRMQEMQLEKELLWMQQNPGEMMPSNQNIGLTVPSSSNLNQDASMSLGLDQIGHTVKSDTPVAPRALSDDKVKLKADGTPDRRYKSK